MVIPRKLATFSPKTLKFDIIVKLILIEIQKLINISLDPPFLVKIKP
jgi:hypothetical protein